MTNFQYYWNWFSGMDAGMELVELSFLRNNTEDFAGCDGFILTGGIDIDPSLYQGSRLYDHAPENFQLDRDRFESDLFRFSQTRGLPLLGICRGLQLVNVLQGGTLQADLGPQSNAQHRKSNEGDKLHELQIQEDSLLFEVTRQKTARVNSAHHQGIDRLGAGLRTNCHTADGIIEGVEWADKKGKPFLLCVQWHPERMVDMHLHDSPVSRGIRDRFTQAIQDQLNSL